MNLKSNTAIVTGASKGLGTACSKALVRKGTTVFGLARSLESLKNIQSMLGSQFIPVQMDITAPKSIRHWVDKTFSDDLLPDILINNAGCGHFGKVDEMNSEQWRQLIDTNINGILDLTSCIVPLMKRSTEGSHILNIGSVLGILGNAGKSGYCASKFAVRGFSEALFKELRYNGIKVTCINPGSIDTNFFEDAGITPHKHMLQPKDIANTIIHILETPDNMLINEVTMRPLNPKPPKD
ncbi:SDR family NAD(P)-dependent oxidoreductase [Aliifodinibius sp. S!AR15-10]|uniref:SDR family oxidoreductase n=1 Tax=Aliifodinibius sp. S!AR15-10 TaxID=2950437 RepID=UPI002858818A|nr:SDR family NAD(P)-dependent oxidoreductase [Aliifodinibius sp. S!AR15-10]MDR8389979.1 SDR family NAD(P)-dependent oxidoreductase [Aliifodinibius sp. S!AR15-10]